LAISTSWKRINKDFNDEYGNFDPGVTLNLQKWYSSAWGWRGRMQVGYLIPVQEAFMLSKLPVHFRGDLAVQLNLSGLATETE
jgi:hypothetical protein